jgi:hypothetical protein
MMCRIINPQEHCEFSPLFSPSSPRRGTLIDIGVEVNSGRRGKGEKK